MYDPENDESAVGEISEADCWSLLGSHEFGRLAYHLVGEVSLTPVNYTSDGTRLYFRSAEGSKLLGITMNHDVAFEIDEFDENSAWSVVVHGRARVLEGHEADVVEALPLRPWVPTAKYFVIAIEPDQVSGRSFRLGKPWLHARVDS